VYYNELIGGVRGAYGKYELDYWGNSYKEAVDWILRQDLPANRPALVFAPKGEMGGHLVEAYVRRFPALAYTDANYQTSDYNVVLNRLLFPEVVARLKADARVHVVAVEDVPLCFVEY